MDNLQPNGQQFISAKTMAAMIMEHAGDITNNDVGFYIRLAFDVQQLLGGESINEQAHSLIKIENHCAEKPSCFTVLVDMRINNFCEAPLYKPRYKFGCVTHCNNTQNSIFDPNVSVSEGLHHFTFSSNVPDGSVVSLSYLRNRLGNDGLPEFDSDYRYAIINYCLWYKMKRERMRWGGKSKYTLSDIAQAKREFYEMARNNKANKVRMVQEEIDQIMATWNNFNYISENPYKRTQQNLDTVSNFSNLAWWDFASVNSIL